MIELSNNEAASLIKLAARGVAYPWGLGEEAAHASRWLVERQLPSLEIFENLFTWVDERAFSDLVLDQDEILWRCSRDELCPLVCGSRLIDSAVTLSTVEKVELKNVVCPMLLLPFISEASLVLERSILATWAGGDLRVHGQVIESVSNSIDLLEHSLLDGSPLSISISIVGEVVDDQVAREICNAAVVIDPSVELWPTVIHSRVSIEPQSIESLKQYAHRTYAPATEQSRLSGAGAGTSDND